MLRGNREDPTEKIPDGESGEALLFCSGVTTGVIAIYRKPKVLPPPLAGWGPISVGLNQFLRLEQAGSPIILKRCRAFTVICRKYLSLPGHPTLT